MSLIAKGLRNFSNVFLLLLVVSPSLSWGQGCSDAGFCTMGAMKPNQNHTFRQKINLRSVELTHYFAFTPVFEKESFFKNINDYFQIIVAETNIGIGEKYTLQVKVPYQFTYGVMANTQGIGDLSYGLTRTILSKQDLQISATLGGKVPTGTSNLLKDNRPLPMYYQPGLGTWDILSGVGINYKSLLFTFGFQHPFNANDNTFLWKFWNNVSVEDSTESRHYQRTNQFIRGTDLMFRVEYNLRFSNWNVHAGLLNIYRLNRDQFKNPANGNKYEDIPYSNGLVSNLIIGGVYRFNTNSAIKLIFAFRLNDRDAYAPDNEKAPNPDGLKRFFVNTISYEYRF